MSNLCPICQAPIPKNAKACPLHRALAVLDNKDTGILLRSNTRATAKAQQAHQTQANKAKRALRLKAPVHKELQT